MIEYVEAAMRRAEYEHDSDGSVYGMVAPFAELTISAQGSNFRACTRLLRQRLTAELAALLRSGRHLPPIDGITLPAYEVTPSA